MKLTYEDWLKWVDIYVAKLAGLGKDDLPDWGYRDAYERGDSPSKAARAAIKSNTPRSTDMHDDFQDPDDDFQDPGGRSALRRATKRNPRNLPCPTCGQPNRLTPKDRALGYQCNACADRDERGW